MSIIEKLKRLVGIKPAEPPTLTDYERLTRSIVRTGNLDWQGLPIDRPRGAGMAPPPWYRRLVDDHLARVGLKIENRQGNPAIPMWRQDQFARDSIASENARYRRPPADSWLHQGGATAGRPLQGPADAWLRR
jgi:hypothetical protein